MLKILKNEHIFSCLSDLETTIHVANISEDTMHSIENHLSKKSNKKEKRRTWMKQSKKKLKTPQKGRRSNDDLQKVRQTLTKEPKKRKKNSNCCRAFISFPQRR